MCARSRTATADGPDAGRGGQCQIRDRRPAAADQGLSARRRRIGDGCVVDHDFATTDVFIILPVAAIGSRYVNYYGPEAERFAA